MREPVTFRVLALQSSERSDERLTLETSFSILFTVAKLPYQRWDDKTNYSLYVMCSVMIVEVWFCISSWLVGETDLSNEMNKNIQLCGFKKISL